MTFAHFWAKAQPLPNSQSPSQPLWAHSLDVAAAARALLATSGVRRARIAAALSCGEDEAMRLAVLLSALHDLGKFSLAFQSLVPTAWPVPVLGTDIPWFAKRPRHDAIGLWLWQNGLEQTLTDRVWPGASETLGRLAAAAFGHHGKPIASQDIQGVESRRHLGDACMVAAKAFAVAAIDLLLREPLTVTPPRQNEPAAFALAGLVNLADWIGSNQGWFPYYGGDAELSDYWEDAKRQAANAVRRAGLVPPQPAQDLSFHALTRIVLPYQPSPAQQWALDIPLPEGPMLVCLEDLTGGGKTEAAHILAARRIAQGRAAGVYWAMPTQATANAMWARQSGMIDGLFGEGARPLVVLAHGQAGLHGDYLASIGQRDEVYGSERDEETASGSAAAWLAEDRRRAFLANVGAGTVDQALLGVLPTRFYPLRLLGLAEKVLVLDEVHSFDAYVTAEIERLIEFQLQLGGDVVLLSATLAASVREKFVRIAEKTLRPTAPPRKGRKRPNDPPRAEVTSFIAAADAPYPLVTMVMASGVAEYPLCPSERVARRVPVRLVDSVGVGLAVVADGAAQGAACCYIRNTVEDAREAWAALKAQGLEPMLFHARFAQCDRHEIEAEVLSVFGKAAPAEARRGRVLVATQVVEQSLDLDFDVLVSDLAPVDSLIQRMGRFRRHPLRDGARPKGLDDAMLVISPEPVADARKDWMHPLSKRMGAVYQNHGLLWRTARALGEAGAVDTRAEAQLGEQVRTLMAAAYDPNGYVPEGLVRATMEAIGSEKSAESIARQNLLEFQHGYDGEAFVMAEDHAIPTRLGEPVTTVRLARAGTGGALRPWFEGDGREAKAWALSEVRLASRVVPKDAYPGAPWTEGAEAVTETWPRYERDKVLAVLEPGDSAGEWKARLVLPERGERELRYSRVQGVSFQ